MPKFYLVSEGITDHRVIKYILAGYFGDVRIKIHELQPMVDKTGVEKQIGAGNWFKVLEYCGSTNFQDIFDFDEDSYVIIHVDTDVCEDYGVQKTQDGVVLSTQALIEAVSNKLIEKIGPELYERYADHFIFAIAVHQIECWLLPLYGETATHRSKTTGCLDTLNRFLNKKFGFTIDPNKKASWKYYDKALIPYIKQKTLKKHYQQNPSLQVFVENLELQFQQWEEVG